MLKVKRSQATSCLYFQVTIFILFFISGSAFGQRPLVDSLKNALAASKEDSNRVDILIDLGVEFVDSFQLVEAKKYANEALLLSQKLGDKARESLALFNLGVVFSEEQNWEEAIKCYEQSLKIWQERKRKKLIAECYNNIGEGRWNQGLLFESLKNHNLALSIREEIKDTMAMAFSHQNIGNVFLRFGKYPEAVQSYLLSLKYYGVKRDTAKMAVIQNSLGAVYYQLKDYPTAIRYHEESLTLDSDEKVSSDPLSNLGLAYFGEKKFEAALEYHAKALKVREKQSDYGGIAISHLNISAVYQGQGRHEEALQSLYKCLEIGERLEHPVIISAAKINMGISYGVQKKFAQAKNSINEGLALASENSLLEHVKEGYRELATIDSIQGDWQSAFSNYKKYILIRDSLINEEKTGEIKYLMYKHESDMEKAKVQIENAKEISIANERTKNERNIWLIGVTSAVLIGGFLFYNFKKKKEGEIKEKVTAVRQEALNAQMSGHFISNTVDSINRFIESNDKEKASEYLLLFHSLIRRVLENSFQKLVLLESDLGVLQRYFELEKMRFKEKNLLLELNVGEEVDLQNTLVPPMIFQTVVENSIKHAFKKSQGGLIKVSIKENLDILECTVEDNGIGRSAAELSREVEEVAYGSSLAERLVSLSGGLKGKGIYRVIDLFDEAGKAAGTRVEFRLPVISN